MALTVDTLWVGYGDSVRRRYRIARLDLGSGDVRSSLDLGNRAPKPLVPDGPRVWVVASDGTAMLVSS